MRRGIIITLIIVSSLSILLIVSYFYYLTPVDRKSLWQSNSAISHNSEERSYRVVTPRNYREGTDYPLVVMLHGYRDRGKQIEFYSGMSNLGDQEGFIALYPEGLSRSWNGDFCCGKSRQDGIDDVGFIDTLIERISRDYQINTEKIFVAGFSNGGILAQKLVNERPGRFAGAAVVMSGSGTNEQSLEISSSRTSMLFMHGDSDTYVPLDEDSPVRSGFNFNTQKETVEKWRQAQQCEATPQTTENDTFTKQAYSCEGSSLVSYIYKDTPHQWPQWRVRNLSQTIPDSTRQIWDFWQEKH